MKLLGNIMHNKLILEEQIDEIRQSFQFHNFMFSYDELSTMYESQELTIAPEYQRFFHWTALQKARLIESILLGFRLPALFVVEDEIGNWELVDGMQRLTTVFEFMGVLKNPEGQPVPPFRLSFSEGQACIPLLDGLTFAELLPNIQFTIQFAVCDVEIIKIGNDKSQIKEIFERLNHGIPYNRERTSATEKL